MRSRFRLRQSRPRVVKSRKRFRRRRNCRDSVRQGSGVSVRNNFAGISRQQGYLEHLVPRYFEAKAKDENLRVVGTPNISDVHFHDGEPVRFKAQFEVFPEFRTCQYTGVEVPYREPQVTEEDVAKRLEELRDSKATYIQRRAAPAAGRRLRGDLAREHFRGGRSDQIGRGSGADRRPGTLQGFTENLRRFTGRRNGFRCNVSGGIWAGKAGGKTVHFHVVVKGLRRKELPEVNDEFAQDLGDFRTVDELKEALRKSIFAQREAEAQSEAKGRLVDKLVDANEFPVPEKFVENQMENRVEQRLRSLAQRGVDPRSLKLDWNKIKESQREGAVREVKASLILGKVAQREAIGVTNDEVDKEVERIARQNREPLVTVRKKQSEDGTLNRIASHIQTEKTLNFLFDKATKTEPDPEAAQPEAVQDDSGS